MKQLLADLQVQFRGELRRDELMARHTSWRIGGLAELFLIPEDRIDLQRLLRLLTEYNTPWMVIGNGSNLLVRDGGIAGAVIHLGRLDRIAFGADGLVEVEAGAQLGRLISESVQRNLGGLEQLCGIPGTVGGALLMNAGAGEAEIGPLVKELLLTDQDGERLVPGSEIEFSYRHSGLAGQGVVSLARLQLVPAFGKDLELICRSMQRRRSQVQNVGGPNAGSVFKNPPGEKAWQLIEAAGLRGERCGDAEVSSVHCNHIVNLGEAAASDVLQLIERIQQRVLEVRGIELELEIQVAGREVESDS